MKLNEILSPSFRTLRRELGIPEQRKPMVEAWRANDSDFCQEVVARGWLTEEQMAHAAERYQLGKSRSGRCIFWMIDQAGRVLDGHIGNSWVSVMLKAREPQLLREWHTEHCLFGAHLVGNEKTKVYKNTTVAVVEREKSAVILSELFPEYLWLATVYPANCNERTLRALQGCHVVLFPPTDETGDTFLAWLEVAEQARRQYSLDVTVSTILEEHASAEQKARHTDLVDFLIAEV